MLNDLRLFRQRNFALMTIADAVSVLGDQLGWVALLWFAMVTTKHSGDMGLLAIAFWFPGVLLGPVAGNVLDRISHRRVLVTVNVLLGVVFMGISLLYRLHVLPVGLLFVLILIAGCLTPFTSVGWMVIVPNLVTEEELNSANTVGETIWNAAMFLGPLLSGLMISHWGAPVAIFADGVSFWVAAVCFFFVRYHVPVRKGSNGDRDVAVSFWNDTSGGIKLLYQMKSVWWITLAALFMSIASGALEVSLPLLTYRELSKSAAVLGAFWGIYFLSSIAGSMMGGMLRIKNGKYGTVMSIALFGWGLSFAPLLFVPSSWMVSVCMGAAGFLFASYPVLSRTAVQTILPKEYQGRIMGVRGSLITIGPPLGAYLAGTFGQWFPASDVMGTTGFAVVVLGLVLLSRRSFRTL